MAGSVEQKLRALGIELHEPKAPAANYVGFVRTGSLLIVSGQVCYSPDGKLIAKAIKSEAANPSRVRSSRKTKYNA